MDWQAKEEQLLALAREAVDQDQAGAARLRQFQSIARQLPGGSLFVVREDDHGDLWVDVAGGEALVRSGRDPAEIVGTLLSDHVPERSVVWTGYRRALKGKRSRYPHEDLTHGSGCYVTHFGPLYRGARIVGAIALTIGLGKPGDELELREGDAPSAEEGGDEHAKR